MVRENSHVNVNVSIPWIQDHIPDVYVPNRYRVWWHGRNVVAGSQQHLRWSLGELHVDDATTPNG